MAPKSEFLTQLHGYYTERGRHDLPWRQPEVNGSFDAYKILVSEVMLQQTQVPRVMPKFQAFIKEFPDIKTLAVAPLGQVLIAWQGLGYNRRAKYLWQAAQTVMRDFSGEPPREQKQLETLPGVGHNTAGAIMAYAFNQPALFIETNIRTVYIHHFFKNQANVPDAAVRELLEQTLDRHHSRQFYWSLMDYGSHLKQSVGNLARSSKAYAKQPKFHGSLRQIRGQTLRLLADGPQPKEQLLRLLNDRRATGVLEALMAEGLIRYTGGCYRLP